MNIPDTIFTRDEVLAFIAADRASASRATPEGWVCVPRQPTEKMFKAGLEQKASRLNGLPMIYLAMIEAAPALTANQAAEAPPAAVEKHWCALEHGGTFCKFCDLEPIAVEATKAVAWYRTFNGTKMGVSFERVQPDLPGWQEHPLIDPKEPK